MIRNLKVLGLALAAVFAMSAVVASAASATVTFHSPVEPTYLTGEQHASNDVFNTDAGEVTCSHATYVGKVAAKTTSTAEVTPSYSGCHLIFIFTFNVTVDHNGCTYLFHVDPALENGNAEGSVDIVCPAGKVIEVTAPGCTVTVPPQTGLRKITFTNAGTANAMDITVDVNLTAITYEEHNTSGSTCASSTTHTTNGTYSGNATVRGYEIQTTDTSTPPNIIGHDNQVNITVE
jgi:hypothetical protein